MKFLITSSLLFDFPGDEKTAEVEEAVMETVHAMKASLLLQSQLELTAAGISYELFNQHVTMFEPVAVQAMDEIE
jgi:hypothetical protein